METDLVARIIFEGVRGSIPAGLTIADIKRKYLLGLRAIQAQGGINKLFGQDVDEERLNAFLRAQPLSVGGTYGPDTTCIQVQAKDSPLIIIDSGSGMRRLGEVVSKRLFANQNLNPLDSDPTRKREIHILFTHYHWDHIQGFPFFSPAFVPGQYQLNVNFYGKPDPRLGLSGVMANQQTPPNFPVELNEMGCQKVYAKPLNSSETTEIRIGNAVIKFAELNHPKTKVLGYSVEIGGRKFVVATDTEHYEDRPVDETLVALASNADIIYYDSQHLPEEYDGRVGMSKRGWGHSTYEKGIDVALAANVGLIVLGHHDPTRTDEGIEDIGRRAIIYRDELLKRPENKDKKLDVKMAYQGLEERLAA